MVQSTKPVQLVARDLDDLSVVSSLCQDALCPASDMAYLRDESTFVLALNRFCWEHEAERPPFFRTHAGLRFDAVRAVASKHLPKSKSDKILCLLSISYADDTVVLSFAEGITVRLSVDSLQAGLADLGAPWPTQWRPDHGPNTL